MRRTTSATEAIRYDEVQIALNKFYFGLALGADIDGRVDGVGAAGDSSLKFQYFFIATMAASCLPDRLSAVLSHSAAKPT